MNRIYLDYNATTPVLPEILEAMLPYLRERFGNPGSKHSWGRMAREAMDKARAQTAALINAPAEAIIFTSHATEANNMALNTVLRRSRARLAITDIEHPAVLGPSVRIEKQGVDVVRVPVDDQGVVDLAKLSDALTIPTHLVSVMLANNETGAIQPLAEVSAIARNFMTRVHVDASQACGKIPVDVEGLGADFLTIAGHKLYAPKGVGALYARDRSDLQAIAVGGGQESGQRHGTENVAYAVALGAACELAARDLNQEMARQRKLGEAFLEELGGLDAEWRLLSADAPRLPNTMSVAFRGQRANQLTARLDELGVGVSAGAACHGDDVCMSHVLEAMNVDQEWARGALRFSWGRPTTEQDIRESVRRLGQALAGSPGSTT